MSVAQSPSLSLHGPDMQAVHLDHILLLIQGRYTLQGRTDAGARHRAVLAGLGARA